MDIQKLRPGNLAKDAAGHICKLTHTDGVNGFFVFTDEALPGLPVNPAPIILTIAWVLKFGFVKKNKATYLKDGYVYKTSSLQTMWCVHHLQNDYYFKTGQELTLV
jgi:hypothetical protein